MSGVVEGETKASPSSCRGLSYFRRGDDPLRPLGSGRTPPPRPAEVGPADHLPHSSRALLVLRARGAAEQHEEGRRGGARRRCWAEEEEERSDGDEKEMRGDLRPRHDLPRPLASDGSRSSRASRGGRRQRWEEEGEERNEEEEMEAWVMRG